MPSYKSNILVSILFLFSICIPKENTLIGKTYINYTDLKPSLRLVKSALYQDIYSIVVFADTLYPNKKFIFMEQIVGHVDKIPKRNILDIKEINCTDFSKNSRIWLEECSYTNGEHAERVVAVYYHDEHLATKGITVTPEKAYRADLKLKKLVSVPVDSLKCGSEAPDEDYPG